MTEPVERPAILGDSMRSPLPVAALLLIVACGGNEGRDSQTERGRDYVEDAASAVDWGSVRPVGEARCFFAGLVDSIGLDTFYEAGVTAAELAEAMYSDLLAPGPADGVAGLELSESQAREGADMFFDCFDVAEYYASFFFSEKDKGCIRAAIKNSDSELRVVVKDELLRRDDTDSYDEIAHLLVDKCGAWLYS